MKQLSIIIPVYNVENYIRECLDSIFRQGLADSDFEIILVNDGTPDNSIEVVSQMLSLHNNITILNQENKGVSTARNAGFNVSQGKYVYFMDSDDLLVDNALSILLPVATSFSKDILLADYCRFKDGDDYTSLLHREQHYSGCLKSGEEAYLEDLNPYECYVWKMLIRRDFLNENDIYFKPFGYEDILFCQECLIKADSVVKANYQLYLYRLRSNSFTSSMNLSKMLDLNSCLSSLMRLNDTVNMSAVVKKRLKNNIHTSFSYGIWCITHNEDIYKVRRTIVSDLKTKIQPSQFMFYGSIKQLLVSVMFRFMPFFYMSLRRI